MRAMATMLAEPTWDDNVEAIGIVGSVLAVEAHTLCAAAEAAGLRITPLPFNTPSANAAIATHGRGLSIYRW